MATTTRKRRKDTGIDYDKFAAAFNASWRALKPFRENRRLAIKEYAGNHYGDRAADERIPLNLISMYIQVMTRLLVAKMPRVMLSTFDKKMKRDVNASQDWMAEQLEKMQFDETLERWVTDAFFSMGILKVALASPGEAVTENWGVESGEAFADVVDLDDFNFDVHRARRMSQATYIGNRVQIPKDVLINDEGVDKEFRKKIASSESYYDDGYETGSEEKVSDLQKGDAADGCPDEFEECVTCWEVYFPRRKVVCLFVASEIEAITGRPKNDQPSLRPIKEMPWVGHSCGPYHFLCFGLIPDNAMAKGPVHDLLDLQLGVNKLLRKAMRQAERMKVLFAVRAAADKEGTRVMNASDGQIVIVDDPAGIVPVVFPGADAALVQFTMVLRDLFDFMAGNLKTLTGNAPSAPTATQEKMLAAGSSAQVEDMALRVLRGVTKVAKSLFWYWWHDPFKTMESSLSIPGMAEISITRQVKPEDRERGSYSSVKVTVDAYSMQPQTPQSRVQAIMSVIQNLFLPLAGVAQQQGINLDLPATFDKLSKYMDQPDLQELFSIQSPPQTADQMGGFETSVKPVATERTYNRVSTSERTASGEANQRTQMMGEAQNSQSY